MKTSAHDLKTHLTNTRPDIEAIRQRAYQLYQERGGVDGYAEEDWLRAEAEVKSKFKRRKAAAA